MIVFMDTYIIYDNNPYAPGAGIFTYNTGSFLG